jgi:hypothetical protein
VEAGRESLISLRTHEDVLDLAQTKRQLARGAEKDPWEKFQSALLNAEKTTDALKSERIAAAALTDFMTRLIAEDCCVEVRL